MYKHNIKFLVFILISIFVIVGCNDRSPIDNEAIATYPINLMDEKQDPPEEIIIAPSIKEELESIAIQYIQAKYNGDNDSLLAITKQDALNTVKSGELGIFQSHQLDKIVSFNIHRAEPSSTYLVIVSVSSYSSDWPTPTIYYEYLYFEVFDNDWLITKIERGV